MFYKFYCTDYNLKLKTLSKKIFFFIVLNFFLTKSFAQQNLFNIPSGDITPQKKLFYQHQLNFYENNFDTKSHLVYGIGKNFDIGVNFIFKKNRINPIKMYKNDNNSFGSLNPLLVSTVQKKIQLYKNKLQINLGTVLGLNLTNNIGKIQFANFNYGLLVYNINAKSRIVGGTYYSNKNYTGIQNNKFEALVGYEINLYKKFYLMGDWVGGNNDIGEVVVGAMYIANKRIQFCSGVLLPNNFHTTGLVLELNILGWDYQ